MHVSYILSGVVVRSSSVAERALVQATSVDLDIPDDPVPKTVVVTGGDVLAAACTTPDRNDATTALRRSRRERVASQAQRLCAGRPGDGST